MNVHKGLLNPSFWRIIFVNMLMSTSVYMLMPLWPCLLNDHYAVGLDTSGWTMLMFGLGLCIPGAVSSFLLDKYRRKSVCIICMLCLVAVSVLCGQHFSLWLMALLRLTQGAAFILFHIALGSTILIDVTNTKRRDITSYLYYWACRFSLAIGPAICLVFFRINIPILFLVIPCVFAIASLLMLERLELPFRAPVEKKLFSRDRFLLGHSSHLIVVLLPMAISLGIQMSMNTSLLYYAYLFAGLTIAFLLHFIVYRNADVRAEITIGLVALIASFLLIIFSDNNQMIFVSSLLAGYGVGAVSGRLQSFFTVISEHTERGSAQTTYKITFDMGICVGFFLGCFLADKITIAPIYGLGLFLVLVSLFTYLLSTHKWFIGHVCR